MRTLLATVATIGLTIALLSTVLAGPAAADLLPPHCLARDGHEPSVGDATRLGDDASGDGLPLLPSGPCYTGKLTPYADEPLQETPSDDADDFVLEPPGSLWRIEIFALDGCGNVTIRLHVNGAVADRRICAGDEPVWWGILTASRVTLTVDDGDLSYAFHHPVPGT